MKPQSILDKILNTPENEMRDDDHMDRPDISEEQFSQALTEIGKKFARTKSKNPLTEAERKERTAEILKAMNSEKNDCNKNL